MHKYYDYKYKNINLFLGQGTHKLLKLLVALYLVVVTNIKNSKFLDSLQIGHSNLLDFIMRNVQTSQILEDGFLGELSLGRECFKIAIAQVKYVQLLRWQEYNGRKIVQWIASKVNLRKYYVALIKRLRLYRCVPDVPFALFGCEGTTGH